ncbi:ADP-forming succinate--CoA ligase subunit beta [Candidatus Woesearchaeota archaeon]|nr:ADP-forming succinate--CoA ligase subunit beta [Candidatus Woesearchaeota archaeon]
MKLKEYQGKELFRRYGIKTPEGYVVSSVDDVKEQPGVVKVQVLVGGRGKAGGIKVANADNIKDICQELLNMEIKGLKVKELLIEEKINIEKELYLSITVNRGDKCFTLIFSEEGGVDIESVPKEKIVKVNFYDIDDVIDEIKNKINDNRTINKEIKNKEEIIEIIKNLNRLMKEFDCELVEINPLVLSNGEYIAADSKVVLDDNALYRHPEFKKEEELTDIEKKAAEHGLQYVELDGDIAIIGNGAGLVMSTLDVLKHFGGKPANFLDVGGGASVSVMEKSLEIVLMKKPKGVFINIFGGITRCDEIAQGLVNYIKNNNIEIPMVVRMIGTNEEGGERILNENGIKSLDSMEECAKNIVEMTKDL